MGFLYVGATSLLPTFSKEFFPFPPPLSVCVYASLLLFSVSSNWFCNILSPPGEWLHAFERPSALHHNTRLVFLHTHNMGGHGRTHCTQRHADTHTEKAQHTASKTLNTHSYALFEGLPIGSQLQCECVTRLLTGLFWNWSTFHPSISSSLPLSSPTSSFFFSFH